MARAILQNKKASKKKIKTETKNRCETKIIKANKEQKSNSFKM